MIFLYNILFFFVIVVGLPLIIPIVLIYDKRRETVFHRLGFLPLPDGIRQYRSLNPGKRPIWVHALSVGEVLSAVHLVKGLKHTFVDKEIIFSASTQTGFEIASEHLKEDVIDIFFFPYDLPFSVERILGKIDPALVLIVETDIWPNFLSKMKQKDVPVILVNARLSERSFVGYKRLLFFIRPVLSNFSTVCVQSKIDAHRFNLLGIPPDKLTVTGNFKFDQPDQTATSEEIERLRHKMNIRPEHKILVAGSTHKGEEAILAESFAKLKKDSPNHRFIVAPRDPKRAVSVRRVFESAGLSVFLMKELEGVNSEKGFDVIVIDAMGVLRKLYALADLAFIGGSLVSLGGHNPLEPAAFSKPMIFGPDMSDFMEVSEMLVRLGGAVRVQDAKDLYETAVMLMENEEKARVMGRKALQVFNDNKGAVEKTLRVVQTYFPEKNYA